MRALILIIATISGTQGFLWTAEVDLKDVIHKLMHAQDHQAQHIRKKLVAKAITGIFQKENGEIGFSLIFSV